MNDTDTESENQYLTKLRRLWKGTLYIGIVASYIGILVETVLLAGWQSRLTSVGSARVVAAVSIHS